MSLVAQYSDSEEEADHTFMSQRDEVDDEEHEKTNNEEESVLSVEEIPSKGLSLFGVGDDVDDNDLDSDDEIEDDQESNSKKKRIGDGIQLDNPFRMFGNKNVDAKDSVFRVEFREEEAQKQAVMERHVKLSQTTSKEAFMVNGKKICWSHRKGRCRFGHNCKFAHTSDPDVISPDNPTLGNNKPEKNFQPIAPKDVPVQFKNKKNPFCMDNYEWDKAASSSTFSASARLTGNENKKKNDHSSDEEGVDSTKAIGKKKRPGLPQTLVPAKKAMNMYLKSKAEGKPT